MLAKGVVKVTFTYQKQVLEKLQDFRIKRKALYLAGLTKNKTSTSILTVLLVDDILAAIYPGHMSFSDCSCHVPLHGMLLPHYSVMAALPAVPGD